VGPIAVWLVTLNMMPTALAQAVRHCQKSIAWVFDSWSIIVGPHNKHYKRPRM